MSGNAERSRDPRHVHAQVAQRWSRRCCDVGMNVRAAAEPIGENRDVDDAWRTYGPAALRFATALVGSHDAHDITTNAFLRATRQPADLTGPRIVHTS